VLIVDDSPLAREVLRKWLSREPDIEVVGEAGDGAQAVNLAADLRPDLVTMDLLMPIMGGADASLRIMRECPCPILVVASAPAFHRTVGTRGADQWSVGGFSQTQRGVRRQEPAATAGDHPPHGASGARRVPWLSR